ncbi:hypothetical protein Vadar_031569 [Vaccinium darrowii]|uniref:Uncharacterized protein n=1 Tax=Vaccinium darrowii TaxID=229202 RepID=A0ACB7YB68_9ERIC|nr:hypothetical protein Vadar_031569 [Vaccinium darrowii]
MWRLLKIRVALAFFLRSLSTLLHCILNLAAQFFIHICEFLFNLLFEQKFLLNHEIIFLIVITSIIIFLLLSRPNPSANKPIQTPPRLLDTVTRQKSTGTDTDTGYVNKQRNSTKRKKEKHAVMEIQRDAIIISAVKDVGDRVRRRSTFEGKKSEKLKREFRSVAGKIRRRSETLSDYDEMAMAYFNTMNRLSSEEFKRAIEDA